MDTIDLLKINNNKTNEASAVQTSNMLSRHISQYQRNRSNKTQILLMNIMKAKAHSIINLMAYEQTYMYIYTHMYVVTKPKENMRS